MSIQRIFEPSEAQPAPANSTGIIGWLRKNIFYSSLSSAVSIGIIGLIAYFAYGLADWGIISADFVGSDRSACDSGGACWVFIGEWLQQFIYGFYPDELLWRVNLVFALSAALIALLVMEIKAKALGLFGITLFPLICFWLLHGGFLGLEEVGTENWGGLMLTLVVSAVGIVASLPLGILLALGRRSKMPIIRSFCTVFIEVWRGVPLITVLFMASVMLPLFTTGGNDMDKLLRAMIGIILFQSAYMAEVVRGGLQAIPKGQYEAANALGLSFWQSMGMIILPQALKIVIPGIVNTFIALFKDTTLLLIIGLMDLLAMVKAALTDSDWLGYATEGYVFVAIVFWILCFAMSQYSMRLEAKLDTGHKASK